MIIRKNDNLKPSKILEFFLQEERRSGVILLIAAIVGLFIANSIWSSAYFNFFDNSLRIGAVSLNIRHWVNDGLMALFFLVVGLEIKREFVSGELQTWRKASFPVFAAIGGMVVPALIFSSLNPYAPQSSGWAIPMATDIAIAVGVIGLLGKRVNKSLRVFLLTLAIVDDIGAIIIIGLFYNQPSNAFAFISALILMFGLLLVRKQRYWPVAFAVIGVALCYCLLLAGISATIAGVVVAFLTPATTNKLAVSELVENKLIPFVMLVIVPLFVFANAGIKFSEIAFSGNNNLSVLIGVTLGLVVGKPLGILAACWLGHISKITQKPSSILWSQLVGVGFLAGIGFTISLLIAGLAYENIVFQNAAVLGIFVASLLSGIIGFLTLHRSTRMV